MAQKRKIEYQPEFLGSIKIPAGAGIGKVWTSNNEGIGEWLAIPSKIIRTFNAFILQGPVEETKIPGINVSKESAQIVKLAKVRYSIESGTKVLFRLNKNGANITGFGTEGAPLEATTTAASTEPTAVECAENDYIVPVISGLSGEPKGLTITIDLQHTF